MEHGNNISNPNVQDFVSLLTKHQAKVYSYILSFVANFNDADDLMQETTKMMWIKFDEFEKGTNFGAWGVRIAHYRILEYIRAKKKDEKLYFDDELIQVIGQESGKKSDLSKEYLYYLSYCIKKLCLRDKDIIRLKYQKNLPVKEISDYFGKTVQGIYQNIARIHEQLLRCVKKQLLAQQT